MKKICPGCGEERDVEQDFNWKYPDRGVRQSRCKYCLSQVSRRHYQNNKQIYMDRARAREIQVIEDSQRRLFEYLACHPCVDCGQTDVRVLEFDHVHGKKSGNISRMVGLGYSWSTIEAEIAKCEVKCGNCHRIKENEKSESWRRYSGALAGHARSRNARSNAENKQRLYVYLSSLPCVDCGQTDVRVLEFDHVRGIKSAYLNKLLNGAVSWKTIEAEIAKCEVRCTNCHRIKTLERGKWWRFWLFE